MKESISVRFLYGTVPGRVILKFLTRPGVSKAVGKLLDSGCSARLIPFFIRKYHISVRDTVLPEEGFRSFNQFFCRREVRERTEASNPGERFGQEHSVRQGQVLVRAKEALLVSPCDAYLSVIPIRGGEIFDIKHTKFTLEDLLQDGELAAEFQDGAAMIFRLTPSHYHRYCFAADGRILSGRKIPGILHCVRPIVTRKIPVYAQNAREYQLLETARFGKIVQMEIGALMIGRITNLPRDSRTVQAGEEKGYFEFGGSTIILLLPKEISAAVLKSGV